MGTLTLSMVGYTFNLRTQEAVAGGPCEFEHSLVYIQRPWGAGGGATQTWTLEVPNRRFECVVQVKKGLL